MKRTMAVVGAAVIALVGAVAVSQAQGRQDPQAGGEPRGGRPEFGCGPERGPNGQAPGLRRGPGGQGLQQGMRGGARGGRQGAMGRPNGPGRPGGPGRGGRGAALCGLDLTDEQQAQIKTIHEKTREQVEAVLTPEQLQKLRARRNSR